VCIDPHKTGFVGKGSDHIQLIKFWPSHAPGKGSAAGRKIFVRPYYSQRAVFASPLSAIFIFELILGTGHTKMARTRKVIIFWRLCNAPYRILLDRMICTVAELTWVGDSSTPIVKFITHS